MNCKKCGGNIPQRIEINNKKYILKSRKLCLTCSPFQPRTSYKLGNIPSTRICISCNKPHKDIKRNICTSCRTSHWRRSAKEKLVAYKGGKCVVCGYNKCLENLSFHHLDAAKKSFSISGAGKGIDILFKEVEKCILVCCRCHGEHHAGLLDLTTFI